jgi:hypothetical protein
MMTTTASPMPRTAHREHRAATMSTNCRSQAPNVRFYMLTLSVAVMLILSDREHRSVMPRRNRNTISHGFADYLRPKSWSITSAPWTNTGRISLR